MQISLCVITAGEAGLSAAVTSALPAVDEVVLVDTRTDRSQPLFEGIESIPQVRVVDFEWGDDFKAARDFGFSQCAFDYVLWLDSDDTLVGAAKLRKYFEERAAEWKKPLVLKMRYDYAFDVDGNCTYQQIRERIVPRKEGSWRVPIHEVWLPDMNLREETAPVTECYVVHDNVVDLAHPEKQLEKQKRNLRLMEKYVSGCIEKKEQPDRRVFFHYCHTLADVGHAKLAAKYLVDFVREEPRGWCKARAYLLIAECFAKNNRWDEVCNFASLALIQKPDALMPYVYLFKASVQENRYQEAMYWFVQAYDKGVRSVDSIGHSPLDASPNFGAAALCCAALGVHDKAVAYAKKHGDARLLEQCKKARKDQLTGDAAVRLLEEIPDDKKAKFCALLPESVADNPSVARWLAPDLPTDKLTIAVHCGIEGMGGGQSDFWGPEDLLTGIGGSETMVLRLMPHLVRAGAHIEVYGPWRKDQVRDGVHYRHYSHFDPKRELSVFIAWRYPELLEWAPESAFKVVWMHDQPFSIFTKEADSCRPDEVWALTQDHKRNIEALRDYPVWVTRNGIENLLEVPCAKVPGYVIYASSPDRGLLSLLQWWPDIKAQRADAQLHIFYGFTKTWYNLEKGQPHLRKQRAEIEKLVKELPDVHWHGSTGQADLHAEMAKACVWAYPTRWPESSCITAMEMGALGVMPVTNNFSALAETVLDGFGVKFDVESGKQIEDYKDEFVAAVAKHCDPQLTLVDRMKARRDYQAKYGLAELATEWVGHLQEKLDERVRSSCVGAGV